MNDVRFAFRQLLKNPGLTAVAVLTLALGIGANTAIFSVMNTIMLRPLPYRDPDRLVRVFGTSVQSQNWPHSTANFLDYREQNTVFERLVAMTRTQFSLAQPGEPSGIGGSRIAGLRSDGVDRRGAGIDCGGRSRVLAARTPRREHRSNRSPPA